ncbi:NAD-dependent epimerase/dehydratase family protein [Caulobacter sp. UNC279MFTsu5.1]|uniref:NAD-dependent epimerase/dehydratase family protein n=1 Tax=Caulobacter sp. UNC279MFTsu5.1 TaxID=1502775 RepID=UPI0003803FD8|nr:NAD-dependent epimerase/dehydratase family protein [Caulobacter sp. UNC279MFTsu5.1]SFJ47151.1 UDP-glucose 4-epimerase [Caulobacter sp. UNC279MFTsu5.1]
MIVGGKRHLILGGGGFLGRHVAMALSTQGDEVVVAGRRPPPEFERFDGSRARFLPLDITKCDWTTALADVDVVHHYAWASIPQTAAQDPIWDADVHIRTAIDLLETASRLGGKRVVFVSSGGTVYGRQSGEKAAEDSSPRPLSIYGATKLAVENYMRIYHASGAVDCRVARLSNPYGVGQNLERRQGLVSTFVARALENQPLTVWGDGRIVRDYIHISDAISALVALSNAQLDDIDDLPIFNVASGVGASINQVISVIEDHLGHPLDVTNLPARSIDIPVSVLCVERARQHLGWSPRLSLSEGVKMMIAQLQAGERHYSQPLAS